MAVVKFRHEVALLLLLLALAAPTRLLGLDAIPPGLFHDEAYEGIDAVRIVDGARPVFLPENYGREPLYAYLMACLVALLGPTAVAVRATSAFLGLLLIPAAYLWGRVHYGRAVGMLVAALTASSYWVLHESRLGMRPIALPLVLALCSACVWLAARRGRFWAWPLGGLLLGLSVYTYLPARLFPLVVAGEVALGWWSRAPERRPGRLDLLGAGSLVVVAGLIALPLGLYFRDNPADASARSTVVSIFASDWAQANPVAALANNLLLNLGMFVWRGDDTLRHNLAFRPVFDPLIAPFFLLGAFVSLRTLLNRSVEREARACHAVLWLWLATMLLPGVLSDSAPHFLRTIGVLPALFALPAVGLVVALNWLVQRFEHRGSRFGVRAASGGLIGLLAVSEALTLYDYFVRLPAQPGLAETFDAPRAALALIAGNPPPGLDIALPTPGWSYATIRFLRPRSFEPPEPAQPFDVRFGTRSNRPSVQFLGYDLEPAQPLPGQPARLTLYWRALREMNTSYDETLRVIDRYGREWWHQSNLPGQGTLPTDTWQPGEVVADRATLLLDPGTPDGTYELEIVLAQPDGGRKLQVSEPAGRELGSSLKLPAIRVRRVE